MAPLRPAHSLIFVTGKGGVGKSVLATSIARLSARAGLRTVLVTLDTCDARHPVLDVPLEYRPRVVDGRFSIARLDAFESLGEYVRSRMPFAGLYQGLIRSKAFRDFAAGAPGFEELMSLGRLYNLAVERDFDRVVFDAPSTGHLRALLDVPLAVQRAVQVGPVHHVAGRIRDLLLDVDRTRVLVATLAEELPIQEALELYSLCHETLRMNVGPILVNRRVRAGLDEATWARLDELARSADASVGLRVAVGNGSREHAWARAQEDALVPLVQAGLPLLEIPRVVMPAFDAERLLEQVDVALAPLLDTAL